VRDTESNGIRRLGRAVSEQSDGRNGSDRTQRAVWQSEIEQIARRREMARQMGGPERVQQQHERGNLTVRERIDLLTDSGSFRERGVLSGRTERRGWRRHEGGRGAGTHVGGGAVPARGGGMVDG